MKKMHRVVEVTALIDEAGRLLLDEPLPPSIDGRVRLLILLDDEEVSEEEWLRAASRSPAFDFLNDPAEDVYSPDEGVPFNVKG